MSNLLIPSKPLMVLPELAMRIGLDEAIAIQQVHYRITGHEEYANDRFFNEGRWWVCFTEEEWRDTQFPWWSVPTISRIFQTLEEMLLLDVGHFDMGKRNRRKWHTINYEAVQSIVHVPQQTCQASRDKRILVVKEVVLSYRSDQIDPITLIDQNDLIPSDHFDLITQNRSDQNDRNLLISKEPLNEEEDLDLRLKTSNKNNRSKRSLPKASAFGSEGAVENLGNPNGTDPPNQKPNTPLTTPKSKTASPVNTQPGPEEIGSSAAAPAAKNKKLKPSKREALKQRYLLPGTGVNKVPALPLHQPEVYKAWFPEWKKLMKAARDRNEDNTATAIAFAKLFETLLDGEYSSQEELAEDFVRGWEVFYQEKLTQLAKRETCTAIPDGERFVLGQVNGQPYWKTAIEGAADIVPVPHAEQFTALYDAWYQGCLKAQQAGIANADPGNREDAEHAWRWVFAKENAEALAALTPDLVEFYFTKKLQAKVNSTICKAGTFIREKWQLTADTRAVGGKNAVAWREWFDLARSLGIVTAGQVIEGQQHVYVADGQGFKTVLWSEMMLEYPMERLQQIQAENQVTQQAIAHPIPNTQPPTPNTQHPIPNSEAFLEETEEDLEIIYYQRELDNGNEQALEQWSRYTSGEIEVLDGRLVLAF